VNQVNPEIGLTLNAAGILTNYHDHGKGSPVILIHGSGPGVSAWANWRVNLPTLAKQFRAIAPDMAGFGFTERTEGVSYNLDLWVRHILGLMDVLEVECADFIGNSFGGGNRTCRRHSVSPSRAAPCLNGFSRRLFPDHPGTRSGMGLQSFPYCNA
jgi:Alpha/beta hydrolase family